MAIFKSKEEREQSRAEYRQRLLNEFAQNKNLQTLKENDKEFANAINENLENVICSARGKEGEMAQVDMMGVLAEQNWLIIKLLSEINQKLDK